jgi:tRNA A37 threonylcarbamoyladenosine biosynthesis protein TsaE
MDMDKIAGYTLNLTSESLADTQDIGLLSGNTAPDSVVACMGNSAAGKTALARALFEQKF